MAEEQRSQLDRLAEPFPPGLIKRPPKGKYGTYVKHSTVTERLLSIVGAYSYEIVQVIHGYAPPVIGKGHTADNPRWPGREHAVVGCVARLTLEIDSKTVSVEEAGDVEDPAMENDGRNLKDASSDAIKRCAMRFGLGLHLWSQDDYFLDRQLKHDNKPPSSEGESFKDDTDDPEAQATRDKYRKRHAEVGARQEAETTAELTKGEAEARAKASKVQADEKAVDQAFDDLAQFTDADDPTPIQRTDYEPPEPVAEVVPIKGNAPITKETIEKAKNALEREIALMVDTRMKCKGACEYLDPYRHKEPCCKNAHLRRLYQTAEAGLQLEHDRKFKDLLHQALAKQGTAHVSELKLEGLDNLISISTDTFMGMLYGAPS